MTAMPNHLKEWRVRAGLTEANVEKVLGWEIGQAAASEALDVIDPETLAVVAPLYGCEPNDLLGPPPSAAEDALEQIAEIVERTLRGRPTRPKTG